MNKSDRRFSVPEQAFQRIPESLCYLRKRSGQSSLEGAGNVHLILNASYFVFSDQDFVFISRWRISAPEAMLIVTCALSLFQF